MRSDRERSHQAGGERRGGQGDHGHVTERMTEHYSHVDVGEKKAVVEGMLRLVKGGKAEAANDTAKHAQGDSKHALSSATS